MTTTASRHRRRAIIVEVDELATLPIYERMQILKQRLYAELALQSTESRLFEKKVKPIQPSTLHGRGL
jgi:hypothetical protein